MSVNYDAGCENAIASKLAPTVSVRFFSDSQTGKKYQQQRMQKPSGITFRKNQTRPQSTFSQPTSPMLTLSHFLAT